MKRFLAITLVLVTLLTIVTPISAVSATSVQLTGITSVPVGGTVTWSASVQPQNADNKAITWKSWYPAVATVDAHGNITGHRVGQAHISAIAANGVKSTCTVNVVETTVTAVVLAGDTTIETGDITTWSATVSPSTATNKAITWKSWNPGVATVDAYGNITGHKAGQAHISAIAANGVKSTCTIHVSEPYSYDSHDYGYEPEYQESYSYTVYITRTGAKYHSGGCRYLRKSKIAISLSNAKAYGYTACSVCRP